MSPGRNRFAFSAFVFLRLLAFIHLIAFGSAWVQIDGLVGRHGIAPAATYFAAAHQQLGATAYRELPSLCWIFGTGAFLPILCGAGVVLSLLLFAGIAPVLCLLLLWAGYLSLMCAGQLFFGFQWDGLLLETTLLAVFVAPWRWLPLWRPEEPPKPARLLVWWLLFRLMFFAGVVKLASGDPTWRNLTALTFHYETQPLPTPLAWYAHQLPIWWQRVECVVMFGIELGVPFLIFLPRTFRHAGALVLALFMGVIAATGNYTFFNALAIVLCLFCLDDLWWRRPLRLEVRVAENIVEAIAPGPTEPTTPATEDAEPPAAKPVEGSAQSAGAEVASYPLLSRRKRPRFFMPPGPPWRRYAMNAFVTFAFAFTGIASVLVLIPIGAPPGFAAVGRVVGPFESLNNYGLFAVMTHPRPELIFEGSDDGREWRSYEFPAKPGNLSARPKFVAPYQPRLDWQLWFAALGSPDQNPWVYSLCEHLLRGTPEVLNLLAKNPFPTHPPKYIRVVRYEYHFTDAEVRARTGQWWRRTPMDFYIQPMELK